VRGPSSFLTECYGPMPQSLVPVAVGDFRATG
jgi:hypothetical protein